MSYHGLRGLGQDQILSEGLLTPKMTVWYRLSSSMSDIYLWSGQVSGLRYDRIDQLRTMSRAFGEALEEVSLHFLKGFDVRGVIVMPIPETDLGHVTFIITPTEAGWAGGPAGATLLESAQAIGARWAARLSPSFPGVQIVSAGWFQYADSDQNKLIIDHWRSQPALWDHYLGDHGGTTQAWSWGLGCFRAITAKGVFGEPGTGNLQPYPTTNPSLIPPDIPPPDEEEVEKEGSPWVWLAVAAVAGYALYEVSRRAG